MTTVTTMNKATFLALSDADQTDFLVKGGKVSETPNMPEGAVEDALSDMFDQPASEIGQVPAPVVQSEFEIVGDAVYLNITLIVRGKSFRIKSVKLTDKRQCMNNWDKDTKQWTEENADVMSVIEMVRTHGSELVNTHTTAEIRLGKAGEKNSVKSDPLAEMLAEEAKKLADAEAQKLALIA